MTYILDFCFVGVLLVDVPVEIWLSVKPEKLILTNHNFMIHQNKNCYLGNLKKEFNHKPVKKKQWLYIINKSTLDLGECSK